MERSLVQQANLRPGAGSGAQELGNFSPQQGAAAPQASGPVLGSSALAPARVPLELSIRPRRILYGLLAVIALLILAATLGMIAWLGFGRSTIWGLRKLFDLASENNIPTYFSTLQLVIAAVLLGVAKRDFKDYGLRATRHLAYDMDLVGNLQLAIAGHRDGVE